ncbi:MAG: thioredoxin domain-containing protein [Gemmatimonadales bacterium]|nr:thioredoxin domain-containing protein [Gemmatimonadales bacterium]MDZ4391280.1 thioredoxin domain-containing protein [Gemmatimonadales bacterium]
MAQGQRGFTMAIAAVAVIGVAFIGWKVFGSGAPSIPANVTVLAADTSGFRGYILGSADAPVEITEYADFQCPGCGAFATVQFPDVRARLIETGKATFRYRDLPLDNIHPQSRLAAHAAACANDQGKFWEVKSGIYQRQSEWSLRSSAYDIFGEIVAAAGADVSAWRECMQSTKYAGRIEASAQEAVAVGARSTPSFLINGRIYSGMSGDQMVRLVDSLIAASAPESTTP